MCFYCREPYDANHAAKCTKRPGAQVNALAVNDLNVQLTDEVLEQLEVEDALAAEFCTLSLNAMAGTEGGEALKLRCLVKNKVMLILVDSGGSHSFVNSDFLAKVGIQPLPRTAKQVQVANEQLLLSDSHVPNLEWWIQGHTFNASMRVLEMEAYDAILGYDWLKANSPITHDWLNKTMKFKFKGEEIVLAWVQSPPLSVQEISLDTMGKWLAGNEVWALAALDLIIDQPPEDDPPKEVQTLFQDFHDVFEEPKGLPPARPFDHAIPTLPNVVPVNSRPYKYSPLHKDEIKRQVKELLAAGLITPSTSPYASPVLLVQKRMGVGDFV